jgi:hypothetical protein
MAFRITTFLGCQKSIDKKIIVCYNSFQWIVNSSNKPALNPTQAKAYLALITSGSLTPPQLPPKSRITRTNAYEVSQAARRA